MLYTALQTFKSVLLFNYRQKGDVHMLIIWIVLEIKNYMNNKKRDNLDYMKIYKEYHL